jgi:hypothetical protein
MVDRPRSNMAVLPGIAAGTYDHHARALALVSAQDVRRHTALTRYETTIVDAQGSGDRLNRRVIEQPPFGSGLE